jgi:hypothetical protein
MNYSIFPTCHFKHAGLKLGRPNCAPSRVVKTCNTALLAGVGALNGGSFDAYVRSGKRSKTRFSGAGTAKMLLACLVRGAGWIDESSCTGSWGFAFVGEPSLDIAIHYAFLQYSQRMIKPGGNWSPAANDSFRLRPRSRIYPTEYRIAQRHADLHRMRRIVGSSPRLIHLK